MSNLLVAVVCLIAGVSIGFFVCALCFAAKRGDE
jgi:uncharacterized protein YneF (UPF0154 family)